MEEDEIMVKHRLQFCDSLKDLRKLRKQLYSAADYFESSYNRHSQKQFVMESSKVYVSKALVSMVDHLGSVAHKLYKFLDQKANQYSATNAQFSCIHQRLSTIESLVHLTGLSHHLLSNNHNILTCTPETLQLGKSGNTSLSSLPFRDDVQQPKQAARTREVSPNPVSFSFTKMKIPPNKEAGKRSVSPLRLPFNLMASKRSVSPSPSINKAGKPPEPRRAISACRRREMASNEMEMEMEAYTKKSKHLLKALLSLHHSRKGLALQK